MEHLCTLAPFRNWATSRARSPQTFLSGETFQVVGEGGQKWKLKEVKGVSQISERRAVWTESTACAKVLGRDLACRAGGTARRPTQLDRVSKGTEGGGEGREGTDQVVQGSVGRRNTWVFALGEMGALEGCGQRRRRGLTQVLTGALRWLLLGEQTVRARVGAGGHQYCEGDCIGPGERCWALTRWGSVGKGSGWIPGIFWRLSRCVKIWNRVQFKIEDRLLGGGCVQKLAQNFFLSVLASGWLDLSFGVVSGLYTPAGQGPLVFAFFSCFLKLKYI